MRRRQRQAVRTRYFAFGSNMDPATMREYVPSSRLLGHARLDDYRLAFTRRSRLTGTGVADIVLSRGMSVWGALYEVDGADLGKLERKEGYPHAYTYADVDVTCNGERVRARTFTVVRKSDAEFAPSGPYLAKVAAGARAVAVPESYRAFLDHFQGMDDSGLNAGLLVGGTGDRRGARGDNIVKVSPAIARRCGLGRFCAVEHAGLVAIARVVTVKGAGDSACEMDQNLRHCLGMRGQRPFGYRVQLHPLSSSLRFRLLGLTRALVRSRSLNLPVHQPYWLDSEKNICVLHASNVRLLGLQEGQYCRLVSCMRQPDGSFRRHEAGLRVFSGTATVKGADTRSPRDYPSVAHVYIDSDIRSDLGIAEQPVGYPLQIAPDIARLLADRLIYYGITLFLGVETILRLAQVVSEFVRLSQRAQAVGSVTAAILITAWLAIVDLRSRIRY